MEEGQKLRRITRTAKDPVRLRRAAVVLASAQGEPAPGIAELMAATERYVREVISAFNEKGFAALDPKWSGGRPKTISPRTRERICQVARCCPRSLSLPFAVWSLSKLAEHLVRERIVSAISRETLRRILHDGGVSWQRTSTWKGSSDPEFEAKMRRVLELYDHPPPDGRVICVDEFGPLNLLPRPGHGWFPIRRPTRLRATYHRTSGVRHLFGALDLASGLLLYRIRDRKRATEFRDFLRQLRQRFPTGRLCLIVDNFSPHRHHKVTEWADQHDIELVFLPTNASWLNWIESEFAALRYFALNGTDHRSHDEQDRAIARYIRWRNQRARPKRNFAVNSKIRKQPFLPKVA
jgi:transposase